MKIITSYKRESHMYIYHHSKILIYILILNIYGYSSACSMVYSYLQEHIFHHKKNGYCVDICSEKKNKGSVPLLFKNNDKWHHFFIMLDQARLEQLHNNTEKYGTLENFLSRNLEKQFINTIDLLTINHDNSIEILKSIPFDTHPIEYVEITKNSSTNSSHLEIIDFFTSRGYRKIKEFPESILFKTVTKKFVFIVPSLNNNKNMFEDMPLYKKNLTSIFEQTYPYYRIIYIDDFSQDNTGDAVASFIKQIHQEHKVTLIKNNKSEGQLYGRYHAAHMCKDSEILVMLDGDDWLPHKNVLSKLNEVYVNNDAWMTYGQFQEYCEHCDYVDSPTYYAITKNCKHKNIKCMSLPSTKIITSNLWRNFLQSKEAKVKGTTEWVFGHLRTFYAALFKKIKKEDLQKNNMFFQKQTDIAETIPCAEMAGNHVCFIPEILYIYNRSLPAQRDIKQLVGFRIDVNKKYSPLPYLTFEDANSTLKCIGVNPN